MLLHTSRNSNFFTQDEALFHHQHLFQHGNDKRVAFVAGLHRLGDNSVHRNALDVDIAGAKDFFHGDFARIDLLMNQNATRLQFVFADVELFLDHRDHSLFL